MGFWQVTRTIIVIFTFVNTTIIISIHRFLLNQPKYKQHLGWSHNPARRWHRKYVSLTSPVFCAYHRRQIWSILAGVAVLGWRGLHKILLGQCPIMCKNMRWEYFPKWWLFRNRQICVWLNKNSGDDSIPSILCYIFLLKFLGSTTPVFKPNWCFWCLLLISVTLPNSTWGGLEQSDAPLCLLSCLRLLSNRLMQFSPG